MVRPIGANYPVETNLSVGPFDRTLTSQQCWCFLSGKPQDKTISLYISTAFWLARLIILTYSNFTFLRVEYRLSSPPDLRCSQHFRTFQDSTSYPFSIFLLSGHASSTCGENISPLPAGAMFPACFHFMVVYTMLPKPQRGKYRGREGESSIGNENEIDKQSPLMVGISVRFGNRLSLMRSLSRTRSPHGAFAWKYKPRLAPKSSQGRSGTRTSVLSAFLESSTNP